MKTIRTDDFEVLKLKYNEGNGFHVLYTDLGIPDRYVVHYSSDPTKNPDMPEGREWIAEVRKPLDTQKWNQEYEGDPFAAVGKVIHPDFRRERHVRPIEPLSDLRLYVGIDPAIRLSGVAWLQIRTDVGDTPQVRIYHELRSLDKDMAKVGEDIKRINESHFAHFKNKIYYEQDKAGSQRSQSLGLSVEKILGLLGIAPASMHSKPEDRIALMNHLICAETKDGEPCLLVHPRCVWAISGFLGLYRRSERSTRIDPTEAVHIMDAIQYPVWNNLHLAFKRGVFGKKERHSHIARNLREALLIKPHNREPDWMES